MKKKTTELAENQTTGNELLFEEALQKLEDIVKQLEKGELSLDESLARFSEGVLLSKACLTKLNNAEQQIDTILHEEEGIMVEKPLPLQEDM
ncbi:exodeoxyribonuclease VII small subunit [Propionispora vibrioides]|uniref:Exodeoxyribonuclease 7 small subunit n=1 Tax=Propionispora vibrioides TaxID=112903 RepID=A0A1H8NFW4_9FIRM|nr:exodeoxyribonuclease VII small subunit [Propionispora vibrioides]SEO28495.1 Exodeoxyribonuclease VII small subunit [Propionispora vibrioides]